MLRRESATPKLQSRPAGRRWLGLLLLGLVALPPVVSAESVAGPRPLSEAERQAVALAMVYIEQGAEGWWERLAEDSWLRQLGREEGIAEIAVRAGPAAGATWTLQTPALRYAEGTVVFTVEFPSGLEETLTLELAQETGWNIREVRSLADPTLLAEPLPEFLSGGPPAPGTPAGKAPTALLVAALGLLLAAALIAALRRRRAAARLTAAAALAAVAALAAACQGDEPASAPKVVEEPLRLGALLELRTALAGVGTEDHLPLFRALAKEGVTYQVGQLWEAQYLLGQSKLNPAKTILDRYPAPSAMPLAELLRGRLAFFRSQVGEAQGAYDHLLAEGADYDGLRQEAAEVFALLGEAKKAKTTLARLGDRGARHADVYYYLAQFSAVEDFVEKGEEYFRIAWQLKPLRREVLFRDPPLASLCALPSLYEHFRFNQSEEPVVEPAAERRPLEIPEAAELVLLGSELTVSLGEARVVVPGGAALAPAETPIEDAVTRLRRLEAEALEELETLKQLAATGGVLTRPLRRRQAEAAARALAESNRWDEVMELTENLVSPVEQAPPALIKLRARALMQADRDSEARGLLVKLAQSDIGNNRRDSATFYQLGELLAAGGDWDRAIGLMRKGNAISPRKMSESRIRQLEMEKRLAESYEQYQSQHFDLRYPRSTGQDYAEQLAAVLEAEYRRLQKWIPMKKGLSRRVEVHLFPLREFMKAYSGGVPVLGIFDGKMRMPFADLKSFHPLLVSILSHELAHAMITDRTDDRAPRWFQEGLAQHIQMVQNEINPIPDLHRTSRILAFPLLESVLTGFGDAQLVELGYYESAWAVHYIESRYGTAGIHRMLDSFARGRTTEQALRRALEVSISGFEAAAWDWCLKKAPEIWPTQVVRYDRGFDYQPHFQRAGQASPPRVAVGKVEKRETRASTKKERMVAWHQLYSARVRAAKAGLGPVIHGLRGGGSSAETMAACRSVKEPLSKVLTDAQIFAAPDRNVGISLHNAYSNFLQATEKCRLGQVAQARSELGAAEHNLQLAAKLLATYGLKP